MVHVIDGMDMVVIKEHGVSNAFTRCCYTAQRFIAIYYLNSVSHFEVKIGSASWFTI